MKKLRIIFTILVCGVLCGLVFPNRLNAAIDYVSVTDTAFGANGGDTQDDTAAIQAAINSLTNGGTVYLPNGTYYISDPLVIDSGIAILGQSKANTIIKAAGVVDSVFITKNYNTFMAGTEHYLKWNDTNGVPQNYSITNLTIDGDDMSINGIQMYGYDFTLKDLIIKNCAENGILEHWSNATTDDTTIEKWNDNQSKFYESFLNNITISNCNVGINWNDLTDAFLKNISTNNCNTGIISSGNIYMQDININGSSDTGIQLNNQTYLYDVNISNSNEGIVFAGWHIVANDLTFSNNTSSDIKVTDAARYTTIEDVVITFTSKSNSPIEIKNWTRNTTINNVKIKNTGNAVINYPAVNVLFGYNLLNNILLYDINSSLTYEIFVATNAENIEVHAASTSGNNNIYNTNISTLDSDVNSSYIMNGALIANTFSGTTLNTVNEEFRNENYNLAEVNNNSHFANVLDPQFRPTSWPNDAISGTLGWWDDAIIIQNAIDSLRETGGTVYIPSGTYGIHTTLTLYSNITLIGDGEKATTIYLGNSENKTLLVTDENSTNFAIKNIGFHGNRWNNTSAGVGLEITGSSFNIENVWVYGIGGNAIYITSTDSGNTYSKIVNLNIKDCLGKGIIYYGSNNVYTDMLTVSKSQGIGLEINNKSHFGFVHLYDTEGAYQFIDNYGAKIQMLISESTKANQSNAVLFKGTDSLIENLQVYKNRNIDVLVNGESYNTQISIAQWKDLQGVDAQGNLVAEHTIYLDHYDNIMINVAIVKGIPVLVDKHSTNTGFYNTGDGAVGTVESITLPTRVANGTVTLSVGSTPLNSYGAPKWGDTLTATLECTTPSTGCSCSESSFKWYADGTELAAGSATYKINKAYVGKTITASCVVSADGYANRKVYSVPTDPILKKDLTITTTNYVGVYDGTAHPAKITITSANSNWNGSFIYSGETEECENLAKEGAAYKNTYPLVPEITNATNGDKNIYYKVIGGDYYNDATGHATINISKKDATLTLSDYNKEIGAGDTDSVAYIYDGVDGIVSCTSSNPQIVSCSVDRDTHDIMLTANEYTNDPIIVTVSATEGTNYSAPESKNITVTISNNTITGNISLSGTAKWGETLTATPTCTNPANGCEFTNYQWYANGALISGQSGSTYTITKDQVGKKIRVTCSVSAQGFNTRTFTSEETGAVAKQDLEVVTTNYNGIYDGVVHSSTIKVTSNSWDGSIVSGTTNEYGQTVVEEGQSQPNAIYYLKPSYTDATNNQTIYFKVYGGTYYNDVNGTTKVNITKADTSLVVAVSEKEIQYPVNGVSDYTVSYTYDGTGTVSCLSSNTSYVTCSIDASNHKVVLTPLALTETPVTVTVSAEATTNYNAPESKTISVTVEEYAVLFDVVEGNIQINGTAKWGDTLTAVPTCTYPTSGCTFDTYKWYANGQLISGANESTYVVDKAYIGKNITVSCMAHADGYTDGSFISTPTVPIEKKNLAINMQMPTVTYDGTEHFGSIKVTSTDWNGKTIVSGLDTNYSETIETNGVSGTEYILRPGATNVSQESVKVYYKITGGDYYNDLTGNISIMIKPAVLEYVGTNTFTYESGATYYTKENVSTSVGSQKVSIRFTPYTNAIGTYSYSETPGEGKYIASVVDNSNYTVGNYGTLEIRAAAINASLSVSGTAKWGQTLTANATCTTPSNGCEFSEYQWYYNDTASNTGGTAISGATSSSYAIEKGFVDKYIYVTAKASAQNYTDKTLTSDVTSVVTKQDLSVTETSYNGAYDGANHGATVSVTSADWNGKVIVSGTSTEYGKTVESDGKVNTIYTLDPAYKDFTDGTKTVYYKITGGDYYNDKTGSLTVKINKKELTSTQITAYSTEKSSGSTYKRTISTGVGNETVELTYTPYANTAGTYTYATSAGSGKYTLSQSNTNYTITSAGDFTLTAPQQQLTKPVVTANLVNNTIILTWNSDEIVDKYEVLRSTSSTGEFTSIKTNITTTTYTDSDVTNGRTYYYKVKAYAGNDSIESDVVSKSIDMTVVEAPVLSITDGTDSLILTWTESEFASAYEVLRSTSQNGTFSVIKTNITGTTYTDNNIINGTTYYYKVKAYNSNSNVYSQVVTKTVKLTARVVTNLTLKANNNKVTLNWDDQLAVLVFDVYRSTDGKKFTKLNEALNNTYTDKGLTYGTTYYYKVRACYVDKCGKFSEVVSKKIKPNKVNLVVKSGGTNNIKLRWDKVGTTGYEVYSSTDNKNWTKVTTITNNSTLEYNVKSLKANKTYYFKARAYKNVNGSKKYGSYSAVVSAKTAPAKPEFSVSIKDYNAMSISVGYAKGAVKYVLQKSLDGKTYTAFDILPTFGILTDDNLTVGKTYYYRVKVCNSEGRCSGWVYANLKQTPKTPSLKVESTVTKKVSVKVGTVNGVDGYRVYRSTSKNGTYELIKELTKYDELTFNDKTKKGVTYYYKVRAYRIENSKKEYSPFSKIKSVVSK